MDQKALIKYGLIALGAYLVYRYIQDQGGLDKLLGTATSAPGATPPTQPTTPGIPPPPEPTRTIQPAALDVTGLVVHPDINDALTGMVRINGVPTLLSIITGDGRIFGSAGTEITGELQSKGIDIAALRAAFLNAQRAVPASGSLKCFQPNVFKDGICIDPFTGKAAPNTMTQAQQNAGVSGLGRYTPYWLM